MSDFSVIMSWKQRPELAVSLAFNAGVFARHAQEVLIVNCGGVPEQLSELISPYARHGVRQVVLPAPAFNRALANNIGAFCSSGNYLFFLDADILVTSDVFVTLKTVLDTSPCIGKIRKVSESQPTRVGADYFVQEQIDTREFVCRGGRKATLKFFSGADGSRCGSGLIFIEREHFLAVSGFNSSLKGWGFEDLDLQLRVQFVLGLSLTPVGEVGHLTHGDDTRAIRGMSREQDYQRNVRECFDNYRQNNYVGSYDSDVREWGDKLSWPNLSA
jgi:hypothetical protein